MDQVALIRGKTDVVSLISEFVPLKKSGRNFTGLCPFHNEKSSSFVVSPERQIWHCFGCQKGGDAYSFLMEYEHVEFPEALKILAKRAGIQLIREQFDGGVSTKKERIYTFNHLAAEYYHFVLTKHLAGKNALSYLLEKRKLTGPIISTFMLGFSPPAGNALVSYLISKKKYKKEDILESGLAFERGGRLVDFFRGRLMFPLYDHRGNVIGFSGRSLTENPKDGPKYINTRETLVYQKGSTFFGMNIAKDEIRKTKRAIIVEGEFDAISSFKEGIGNVVASKGTALTENQIQLLSRFAEKVSLCLDQDAPGQDAMFRALPLLEKKGITTTVIVITNGKDPDEAIQNNAYLFKKAVKEDIPVYDFAINRTLSLYDKLSADGKKHISLLLLPLFARIENEIVKEHYVKKLSEELNTTHESIIKEMDRLIGKPTLEKQLESQAKIKRTRLDVLEEYLFSLILQYSKLKEELDTIGDILSGIVFENSIYKRTLDLLQEYSKKSENFDINLFAASLPTEMVSIFNSCYLFPLPSFQSNEKHILEIKHIAKELKMLLARTRIRQLGEVIKNKEKEEPEKTEELRTELTRLITELSEQ